uniref:Uncharacterized protein n=1 Tax=Desertifilum tharense IPPAS B-1220 TaxID=1781255 RepID=A0ACD5GWU6_9CYAN
MVVNSRPVIPYPPRLFQDRQILEQFLLNCQQNALAKKQPHLVSISQEIPGVDPLLVLQEVAQPNQLNFYWENRNRGKRSPPLIALKPFKFNREIGFKQHKNLSKIVLIKLQLAAIFISGFLVPTFFVTLPFSSVQPHPMLPFQPLPSFYRNCK